MSEGFRSLLLSTYTEARDFSEDINLNLSPSVVEQL